MTRTAEAPVAVAADGDRPASPLIPVLAVTQTTGYGVLMYAFPVLLAPIAVDLHTNTATVTGGYTMSIVTGAVAAIPAGRWLDRHGGRALMTLGSVLAVLAVLAWSQVTQVWQLYAVFALIGLAGAATLYEVAFAVVIAATDPDRRDRALLGVTTVAGFACTIFLPLTGWLLARYGWRTALVVLAGLLAATAVPGHLAAVPARRLHHAQVRHAQVRHAQVRHRPGTPVAQALRDRRFWLLAGAFVAHGAATSAVGVLLVAFLRQAGQPATVAAAVAGLLGVLSVTGRLVTTGLARRYGMTTVTAVVLAVQAVGAAALSRVGGSLGWAALCITAFGLGFGVATIARPAILAHRYGVHHYATIAGAMSLPVTLAKAAAPVGAAALGVGRFLPWAAGATLLAAGLLWAARD